MGSLFLGRKLSDFNMDAINKKMQSMKVDIDEMYKKIEEWDTITKETGEIGDKFECDIRDTGKKVQKMEVAMEEIFEKLQLSSGKLEEADKEFKEKEEDVNAANRRNLLLEEEYRIQVEKLAGTIMKLAKMSKDADNIIKNARHWESKTMNNECEIETVDNQRREAEKIGTDNEMKYDNLARSLSLMLDELTRADERVVIAEGKVSVINDELHAIGDNQKQLEVSEEKARRREEKYQDQIKLLNIRLKQTESRSEYAEMNISKLHLRIDELEDDIIREKLKINAVSGQLDDTFNEMLNKY